MSLASSQTERECRWLRERIAAALEALEAGDVAGACEALLGAQDGPSRPRSFACPYGCGFTAEWPGLVDAHVYGSCTAYPMAA